MQPGAAGAEAVEQAQGTGFLQNGQLAPQIVDDSATHVVSTYEVDTAALYGPFESSHEVLGDLDPQRVEEASEAGGLPARPAPRSVVAGRYVVPEDGTSTGVGFALHPRGYATFGGYQEAPISGGAAPGAVTMYSKLFGSVGDGSPQQAQAPFEVVGEYSVDALHSSLGEASFMPLGSYDVTSPSLVGGPQLATSTTGFGIPGTNELAIGSFDLLDGWNVERPISAIRIRVEGSCRLRPGGPAEAAAGGVRARQHGIHRDHRRRIVSAAGAGQHRELRARGARRPGQPAGRNARHRRAVLVATRSRRRGGGRHLRDRGGPARDLGCLGGRAARGRATRLGARTTNAGRSAPPARLAPWQDRPLAARRRGDRAGPRGGRGRVRGGHRVGAGGRGHLRRGVAAVRGGHVARGGRARRSSTVDPTPETGVGAGVAAKARNDLLSAPARECGVPRRSASVRRG